MAFTAKDVQALRQATGAGTDFAPAAQRGIMLVSGLYLANLLLGDDGKLRLIDFGNGVQHGSASAQRDSQQLAMCIVAAALGHIPSAGRLDAWLRLDVAGALARSATRAVGRDMDAAALADAVAGEVAATRRWRVVVGAAVTIIVFGGMLLAAEVAAM